MRDYEDLEKKEKRESWRKLISSPLAFPGRKKGTVGSYWGQGWDKPSAFGALISFPSLRPSPDPSEDQVSHVSESAGG